MLSLVAREHPCSLLTGAGILTDGSCLGGGHGNIDGENVSASSGNGSQGFGHTLCENISQMWLTPPISQP